MSKRDSFFLFLFELLFALAHVHSHSRRLAPAPAPGSENKCGSISDDCEYSCVPVNECLPLAAANRAELASEKPVACSLQGISDAVCCPNCSQSQPPRFRRQLPPVWTTRAPASVVKDPYLIAQQKCVEYSAARYVNKTKPSQFSGRPPIVVRTLDCVKAQPLIHGGTRAELKEFPHMALIGFNDRSDRIEDANWDCGGTLISERFVLSAAHCVSGGNGDAKWVRLGEYILDDPNDKSETKDFRIAQRFPHPKYTSSSVYYDIALFRLLTNVQFTPFMRPLCLFTATQLPPEIARKALITGWGVTATGDANSEVLLKATVNIVQDSECKRSYKNDKFLKNGYDSSAMICAGDAKNGNDTCQGDSGGPLQIPLPDWSCMYYQIGITSYGDFICGRKGVNAIYTKVSLFIPWIQSIVWP